MKFKVSSIESELDNMLICINQSLRFLGRLVCQSAGKDKGSSKERRTLRADEEWSVAELLPPVDVSLGDLLL